MYVVLVMGEGFGVLEYVWMSYVIDLMMLEKVIEWMNDFIEKKWI